MADVLITSGQIKQTQTGANAKASIDAKYGPYIDLNDALSKLTPTNTMGTKLNYLTPGLTIGVYTDDTKLKVVEYIVEGDVTSQDITTEIFKLKQTDISGKADASSVYTKTEVDNALSNKINKVTGATGKLPKLKSDGTLESSGIDASTVITDISGKADKVNNATANDFAALDGNGNLIDSGKKSSDFATPASVTAVQNQVSTIQGNYVKTTTSGGDPVMDSSFDPANDCVRVDESLNLTEAKKQIARSNINAINGNDLKTINGLSLVGNSNLVIRSAYEEWLAAGNTGSEQEFLASLKAQFGSFVPADYGTNGVPASGGSDITASADTIDYIYLVDNDDTTPTAKTMWITVVDDSDPSNITYSWTSIGDVQVNLTFGSGQALNNVRIKDENGKEITGPADVLSADASETLINLKHASSLPLTYKQGRFNPSNGNITVESDRICACVPVDIHYKLRDNYEVLQSFIVEKENPINNELITPIYDNFGYYCYDVQDPDGKVMFINFRHRGTNEDITPEDNPIEVYYCGVLEVLTEKIGLTENTTKLIEENLPYSWVDISSRYPLRFDLVEGFTACRIGPTNGNLLGASGNSSGVTDLIPISDIRTKEIKISSQTNQYNCAVAYYNINGIWLGSQFSNTEIDSQLITIPSGAFYIRFSSTDSTKYAIYARLPKITTGGDIDTSNAVTYRQNHVVNLGTNMVTNNTIYNYDSSWSVENGIISYLGGNSDSLLEIQVTLETGNGYYIEGIQPTGVLDSGCLFGQNDGFWQDPYNGTSNFFCSLAPIVSGTIYIKPKTTSAFTITNLRISKVLPEGSSEIDDTRTLDVMNVGIGNYASLIDGKWNVSIGPVGETMSSISGGSRSIAIGYRALKSFKDGMQNIGIGTFALAGLKQGNRNIAIGPDCLWRTQSAEDNIAIGKKAINTTGTASKCVGVGQSTLMEGNPEKSVAIGYNTLPKGNSESIGIGFNAGSGSSGNANLFVGVGCGSNANIGAGQRNIFIGRNVNATTVVTESIGIGVNVNVTASNQIRIGNANTTQIILGNKLLIFNNDGTVTWQEVV